MTGVDRILGCYTLNFSSSLHRNLFITFTTSTTASLPCDVFIPFIEDTISQSDSRLGVKSGESQVRLLCFQRPAKRAHKRSKTRIKVAKQAYYGRHIMERAATTDIYNLQLSACPSELRKSHTTRTPSLSHVSADYPHLPGL